MEAQEHGGNGADGAPKRDAGASGSDGPGSSESKFVSVTVDSSGQKVIDGGIGISLFLRTVEAPGVLALEDELGTEQANLDRTDYAMVLDIVLDPSFSAALQNPNDCHDLPDGVGGTVTLVWTNIGPLADSHGLSCLIGGRNATDHPYNHLYWLLIDLQKKYLPCPLKGVEEAAARPACAGCWGWTPPDGC